MLKKLVIFAGGLGTRISEETKTKPKPMVNIGKKPIIIHIINYFKFYGVSEFIICAGYKKEYIFKYFKKNFEYKKLKNNQFFYNKEKNIKIHFCDTGLNTQVAGRLKKVKNILKGDKNFFVTYGDGLSDIDLNKLVRFHKFHKKVATISAVNPPARFGALTFKNNLISSFTEKFKKNKDWINGGFFIFNKKIFKYIKGNNSTLEKETFPKLASINQLTGYKHKGFWQCMDTIRERNILNKIYKSKRCPWKNPKIK
jgi:glucose-1-phosphate cytidylyltransferase